MKMMRMKMVVVPMMMIAITTSRKMMTWTRTKMLMTKTMMMITQMIRMMNIFCASIHTGVQCNLYAERSYTLYMTMSRREGSRLQVAATKLHG